MFCNDRGPGTPTAGTNTIVQNDMSYADAVALAELKGEPFRGQSCWTSPLFSLRLENQVEALAAIRKADIWAGLTPDAAAVASA